MYDEDDEFTDDELAESLAERAVEEAADSISALPRHSFLTGQAGTGKSHQIRALDRESSEVLLCATTGIAAINLGGTTINSVLGFYDLDSLKSAFQTGGVQARLRRHREDGVRVIVIDETSMLGGEQLTIIKDVFDEVNEGRDPGEDDFMKLMLVGDFAQLPPVKAKFAFQADCWEEDFQAHTTKLTKIWRQDNPKFIEMLNHARVGNGEAAADLLSGLITWEKTLDNAYDGPTIFAKNEEVDRHNLLRLRSLPGDLVKIPSARGGREKSEWKSNIPQRIELKVGAPVMVLANARDPQTKQFIYVNGDLGHFMEAGPANSITGIPLWCKIKLERTGHTEFVNPVRRTFSANPQKEEFRLQRKFKILTTQEVDEGVEIASLPNSEIRERIGEEKFKEYLDLLMGWVEYMPLRIAYASTVHKCVAPGTRVPVERRGLLPIEDIQIGDIVLTGQGTRRRVLATAQSMRPLIRVRMRSGIELLMSPEHPLMTPYGSYAFAMKRLRVKLSQEHDESSFAAPLPSVLDTPHGKRVADSLPTVLDSEVAWVLGALVGDGCYTEKVDGMIEFAASAEDVQLRMADFVEGVGVSFKRRKIAKMGGWFVSKALREWLKMIGLDYVKAEEKTVPEAVFRSGLGQRAAFLRGLFDTDGCMDDRAGARFVTSSPMLARDVQLLLLSCGVFATKSTRLPGSYRLHGVKTASKRNSFEVRVPVMHLQAFSDRVGFNRNSRREGLERRLKRGARVTKNYADLGRVDEVVAVEATGLTIPMYDIEVEGEHSFIANGVVTHNCQGLSLDKAQISISNFFFSNPGSIYVALSRARTPEGLRLVGSRELFVKRCKVDKKVERFL